MFALINIFMCSCGVLMCISSSPVESVIYLILTFCGAVIVLFMFHVEFLGLVLIIIYVGAVAVLFLFVIMMLNIKNEEEELENNGLFYYGTALIFFLFFFFFTVTLSNFPFFDNLVDVPLMHMIDDLNNIDVLGQVLFNYYLVCFLLAGIILLIALIGAIVLTLKFNTTEKSQNANRQLARTENFISFFK